MDKEFNVRTVTFGDWWDPQFEARTQLFTKSIKSEPPAPGGDRMEMWMRVSEDGTVARICALMIDRDPVMFEFQGENLLNWALLERETIRQLQDMLF